MPMPELKIGADPELWIIDNATKKPISADGLFPGTKEEPFAVERGAIQVDGMAAEYNIHPALKRDEFVYNNLSVLCSLRDEIKKNNPNLDFSFGFTPVASFGKEYIDSQPELARRLGCTPDYNAWLDGAENPVPDAETPFRTASGHIHLGWGTDLDVGDPEHIEACCMMVKQLDCDVGLYFPTIENKDGKRRRELYGKAGAFRPKKYGVEYRTPSNVWLKDTAYMKKIFSGARSAFEDLIGGHRRYEASIYRENVQDLINKGDKKEIENDFGTWRLAGWDYGNPVKMDNLDRLKSEFGMLIGIKEKPALVNIPMRLDAVEDDGPVAWVVGDPEPIVNPNLDVQMWRARDGELQPWAAQPAVVGR